MQRCEQGHENPDASRFCAECGSPLGANQSPTSEGAVAASNPRAGWLPDPTARYEHRYWDGAAWTEHVYGEGQQGVDPLHPISTVSAAAQPSDREVATTLPVGRAVTASKRTGGSGRRRWLLFGAVGVVLVFVIAVAVGASVDDDGDSNAASSYSNYAECMRARETTFDECDEQFGDASGDMSDTSDATFGTTTTTTTTPRENHIGDLITYTRVSDDSPYATLKVIAFNPSAGCTESYGCDTLNDGRPISAIDAELCATGDEPVPYNELAFKIATQDNRQWDGSAYGGTQPEFGYGDLQPGLCTRGWVNVKGPTAGSAPISAIIFSYAGLPMTRIVP